MKFNRTIKIGEILFEVEGEFEFGDAGDNESTPPEEDEVEISAVTAYIPKNNDPNDDEQIAVDGHAILDFGDAWEALEEELAKNLKTVDRLQEGTEGQIF